MFSFPEMACFNFKDMTGYKVAPISSVEGPNLEIFERGIIGRLAGSTKGVFAFTSQDLSSFDQWIIQIGPLSNAEEKVIRHLFLNCNIRTN